MMNGERNKENILIVYSLLLVTILIFIVIGEPVDSCLVEVRLEWGELPLYLDKLPITVYDR